MALRVLVSDDVGDALRAVFEREGVVLDYRPGLAGGALREALNGAAGLIVRSATRVSAEVLGWAPSLRVVARAGVGVDNVDLDDATRRGVLVMNTPDANTTSAAEHTLALLLSLARNVPQASARLRQGGWDRARFTGTEVAGKTLGVIGLGKIGRQVARRAHGLDMRVLGHDPFVTGEVSREFHVEPVGLDELLARSDFISVHVPLTEKTRGLIGPAALARCRQGVRVLNVARGGIVDEAALAEALRSGHVAGAALDVFEREPPEGSPLLAMENVVGTPHLGASTVEALQNVGVEAARQVCAYLLHGTIANAVNAASLDPASVARVEPYRVLAERIGSIQAQLLWGQLRQIRVVFRGEAFDRKAQEVLRSAVLAGFLGPSVDAPVNLVNAPLFARERGIQVVTTSADADPDFHHLLSVEVETDRRTRAIAGTLFGHTQPMLVRVEAYPAAIGPEGVMLFCSNDDTPGVLGFVAGTLGSAGVNIANMSMGRDVATRTALAVLSLDSPVPPETLARLSSSPHIIWVRTVKV
ncbi:MAG: phosphoglycerate dehydrogenase [Planctomycetes bacterium]|nr:phosphoglycerate dehydrogenase [Planctomycetota bacterium]